MNGIVTSSIHEKRFGFISPDDDKDKGIYFHFSNVADGITLYNGEPVSFKVRPGRDGRPIAFRIKPLWR